MDIINKDIEFDKFHKAWLDEFPVKFGYNELTFNYVDNDCYDNLNKIEQNIHFIWIGSLIKKKYIDTIINCKRINKDYSVYLWVDNASVDNEIYNFIINNGINVVNIYDELNHNDNIYDNYIINQLNKFHNYGFKADIIRLYVVYSYGGIYSDIDSVWLKPFDENFDYEFVSYRIDIECSSLGNCFFGFCKGSIVLNDFLNNLDQSIDCLMKLYNDYRTITKFIPLLTGSTYMTKIIVDQKYKNLNYMQQAYCVIGGPHENLHSNFSRDGICYCYQTFDNNWS